MSNKTQDSYAGQCVYITGASSGIGRDLALQFAAAGARLGLFARRNERLDELVREIKAEGGAAFSFVVDVSDRAALLAQMRAAAVEVGPCDLLISNAGVSFPLKVGEFDAGKAASLFSVNYFGALNAMEAVLPSMIARKCGHIVGISSLAGFHAFPFSHVYCASKAALNAQLQGMRVELRPLGINVTTICPGFIRTELTAKLTHKMPMLMNSDVAAAKIFRAIKRRRKVYAFPWPMYLAARLARFLPDFVAVLLEYE